MKFYATLLALLLFSLTSVSQTVLLNEDFEQATDTTPPPGWTIQTVVGDTLIDIWRFDNPGRRVANAPISGRFACFDSDKLSDNDSAEEVYLVSSVFDATISDDDEIWLEFDEYFLAGYNGACAVELFNGASWVSVYSNNVTTNNSLYHSLNISTYIRNVASAQLRFKWSGNFSYFWIIDNVNVKVIPSSQIFIEQTGTVLQRVYTKSDAAWGDLNNDGYLDLVVTGNTKNSIGGNPISKIYINNNGVFEEVPNVLRNLWKSSVKLCDYNNDGLLDILISGYYTYWTTDGGLVIIYKNLGDGIFSEVNTGIKNVGNGFIDAADYNNDGKKDLLVVGDDGYVGYAAIYKNNGNDIFEEQSHIVIKPSGSGGWLDYNNDGLVDFMVGNNFYKNNGDNSFVIQEMYGEVVSKSAFFDFFNNGSLDILTGPRVYYFNNNSNRFNYSILNLPSNLYECFDYNNDGYMDLFNYYIYGSSSNTLFKNNGTTTFINTQISLPLGGSTIKAADYDNDGDIDFFMGFTGKVYKNAINESNNLPSIPIINEAIVNKNSVLLSWSPSIDVETPQSALTYNLKVGTSSGNDDIVSSQSLSNGKRLVHDYGNTYFKTSYELKNLDPGTYYWSVQAIDGVMAGGEFSQEGQFVIQDNNPASLISFTTVSGSNMTVSWTRGSGEQCIVFCKEGIDTGISMVDNVTYHPDFYFGDGSQFENTEWYCVYKGIGTNISILNLKPLTNYTIQVFEFDGNEGNETYYEGEAVNNPRSIKTVSFSCLLDNFLFGGQRGDILFNDFDSDGDLDIVANGTHNISNWTTYPGYASFYANNQNFNFPQRTSLWSLRESNILNNDFNNDNCVDMTHFGLTNLNNYHLLLLKNDCIGNYVSCTFPFLDIREGSVSWSDYDNDGDNDVIVSGNGNTKLYRKVNTIFEEDTINSFIGVTNPRTAWADYNNDNLIDLLLTGHNGTKPVSLIYENIGEGVLQLRTNIELQGVSLGAIDWGDYDNDGNLDILITGNNGVKDVSLVYKNTGANFVLQEGIILTGVSNGDACWADFNDDGYLDIIIAGDNTIKLYFNNRNGAFSEQIGNYFISRDRPRIAIGDLDNDGDVDFATTGGTSKDINIYRNDILVLPKKIDSPGNLKALFSKNLVQIKWDRLNTINNVENVYSYNVEIWNEDSIFCSSLSNFEGKRKIAKMGNAQKNNSYLIKNLPLGTYFWRVQAINNSYIGGPWSETASFTVKELQADFISDTVCLNDSTQFTDQSVYAGLTLEKYLWDFGDGSVDSVYNPKHLYQNPGSYLVKYKVSSENFADSTQKVVVVKKIPTANFNIAPSCVGDTVFFNDLSVSNGLNLIETYWDLGDGKFSNEQNPKNVYFKGNYKVKLKSTADNGCADTLTKSLLVAEYPSTSLSIIGDQELCPGDTVALFVGDSSNSNYSYRWLKNGNGYGASDSYMTKVVQTGDYSVAVENTIANCIDTSSNVSIVAYDQIASPAISIVEGDTVSCEGESLVLSVSYNPAYNYQWFSAIGAVGSDSSMYVVENSGSYYAVVTYEGKCEQVSANTINVTIDPLPVIPSITQSGNACDSIKLTVRRNNAYEYQWMKDGIIIENATDTCFYVKDVGTYTYSLLVTDITGIGCSAKSEGIPVTIYQKPEEPFIDVIGSMEFCHGDTSILKINSQGLYVYWTLNYEAFAENVDSVFAIEDGTYSVQLENEFGCTSEAEVFITVNQNPRPVNISLDGSLSFCEDESVTLSVNPENGFNYQWYKNENAITGASANDFIAYETGSYYVYVFNETECNYVTPAVAVVSSEYPPQQSIQIAGDTLICPGEDVIMNVIENSDYTYKWKHDGVIMPNSTSHQYTAVEEGKYTVDIYNSGCGIITDPREVVYKPAPPKPEILAQGPNVWILGCSNDSAQNYRWYFEGEIIPGASEYIYLANQNLGEYSVSINNGGECYISSDIVTIPFGEVSINELGTFGDIEVYPNPTPGVFHIKMDNQLIGKIYVRITNINGETLFNMDFEKHTRQFHIEMSLGGQGKGMYFIEFRFEKDVAVRKVVVE